jgi:hypothetical protein
MSVATFNAFLKTIDPSSQGFIELTKSVSSAPDLALYARKHGIELSTEEAAGLIESGRRELEAARVGPLTEDALETVNGGSFLGVLGAVGAGIGLIGGAIAFFPAVAGGATIGFVAGAVGTSTVSAGGLGAMIGGAIDLIKGD